MTSQYDTIGSKYTAFKEMVTSVIEEANIRKAITPYLEAPNVRVLDLAAGTGYYSKKLVDWGADYVLGVDLSTVMVTTARAQLAEDDKYRTRVRFQVGDALSLGRIEAEEPFDIVLGAWLLNYASSSEEMTRMYRSIAANLKDGGVFIALTPRPTEDLDDLASRYADGRRGAPADFPIKVEYYERLESGEGWKTEVRSAADGSDIVFRNFHLKKSLYEEGARRGGFQGEVGWQKIEIPEHARVGLARQGWEAFLDSEDQIGILVAIK